MSAVGIMLFPHWSYAQSNLGHQPVGTTKPNDPELVYNFNAILESAFQGAFEIPRSAVAPHPELPSVTYYSDGSFERGNPSSRSSFAFHPTRNTFYYGGGPGAYNGDDGFEGANAGEADSIAEFTIPTLTKNANINDRSGYQEAGVRQTWTSVFKDANGLTKTDAHGGGHTITGLFFDRVTQKLCAQTMLDYDVFPYTQDNMVCYLAPDNLASSEVQGYYSMIDPNNSQSDDGEGEAAHAAAWMADIPKEWQTKLGGRVLFGAGQNFSILKRMSAGVTLFAGTLDNLPTKGSVNLKRWMDFWALSGKQMGAHWFPASGGSNWYNFEHHNCDRSVGYNCGDDLTDSSKVVPWINDWMTITSSGVQGFIIPETRTYVVIGVLEGGEFGSSYKGTPGYRSTPCGGPCRVKEDDYHNKYWLFDLDDMLDPSREPWEVFPYEHGYLPFLDQMTNTEGERATMLNASFDLHTGRLAIVMGSRHGRLEKGQDALIFSLLEWQQELGADAPDNPDTPTTPPDPADDMCVPVTMKNGKVSLVCI